MTPPQARSRLMQRLQRATYWAIVVLTFPYLAGMAFVGFVCELGCGSIWHLRDAFDDWSRP